MKVFICGITGNQGSALARLLLPSTPVVGLTRNTSSATATALSSLGAEILPGSYDDIAALTSALDGCTALFLNPIPSYTDAAAERRDGLAILLAAAKAAGTVTHVVYSTALSVDAPETLPNYDPAMHMARMLEQKHRLEGDVRDSGIPRWTILRPGNFMANYVGEPALARQRDLVFEGVSATALARDTKLPMVDTATIGAFARAALLDADRFDRREIALVDELLTLDETLAKLGAAAGRTLTARYMTDEEVEAQKMLNPMVGAQYMMRGMVQFVDMDAVRSWGVPLSSFDKFLEREAAVVKETFDGKDKTA